jgi:hypothetical protein
MSTNRPSLAHLLAESTHKANQERVDKQQVERITAAVRAQLAHNHKAETSKSLACPSCGAPLPESWRTDDVTSGTDEDDDVNVQDDDDEDDDDDDRADKATALKAKYANRNLTVVDRILINRGFDPFTED